MRIPIPPSVPRAPVDCMIQVGVALYGGRWQGSLAKIFNVGRPTVLQWLGGDVPPPADVDVRLADAARRQAAQYIEDADAIIRLAEILEARA
jgi:hypothetical protein